MQQLDVAPAFLKFTWEPISDVVAKMYHFEQLPCIVKKILLLSYS